MTKIATLLFTAIMFAATGAAAKDPIVQRCEVLRAAASKVISESCIDLRTSKDQALALTARLKPNESVETTILK
jgi:hypothetical protein